MVREKFMIYFILFTIKIIDNIISTAKSILTFMNKKFLSSLLVTVSQLLFYTIIKQVMSDDSIYTIIIVSVASGIGNYLAFPIIDKFKNDDKWNYYLTSSNKEDVMKLCKYLAENNIKYVANLGLTRNCEDTINITAFSKTKEQSRTIENFIVKSKSKYLKEIMK